MVESVTASLVLGVIAVVLAVMTIVRAVRRRRTDAASHAAREHGKREASRRRRAA